MYLVSYTGSLVFQGALLTAGGSLLLSKQLPHAELARGSHTGRNVAQRSPETGSRVCIPKASRSNLDSEIRYPNFRVFVTFLRVSRQMLEHFLKTVHG